MCDGSDVCVVCQVNNLLQASQRFAMLYFMQYVLHKLGLFGKLYELPGQTDSGMDYARESESQSSQSDVRHISTPVLSPHDTYTCNHK